MSDGSPEKTVFSMRVVSLDHYMTSPRNQFDVCYSSFNGESIKSVPVVRIFGATPVGQKCCLHLHKTFPYFFIRIPETEPLHQIDDFLRTLAVSIERAVRLSFGARGTKEEQFIHSISLVKGKPFYGFYACPMLFLRVFIYNPVHLTRVVNLLRSGSIMGRQFEIYEAHIPYLLQVCIDYGLYGMNLIHLSSVQFREPLPLYFKQKLNISGQSRYNVGAGLFDSQKTSNQVWISDSVPPMWISNVKKQTHCELEVDAFAEDITNITDCFATPPLSSDPKQEMIVKSLAGIWREEKARRRQENLPVDPTPEDSGQESLQNANWSAHTPTSLERHQHEKLDKLLQIDARRYQEQQEHSSENSLPSEPNSASPLLQHSANSNMTYEQLHRIESDSRHIQTSAHLSSTEAKMPISSQYQPEVNEQILTQHSDLETFRILREMNEEESEVFISLGGQEVDSEDEEDEKNSQQDIKDIIESSRVLHESESEPLLFFHSEEENYRHTKQDVVATRGDPYNIEDIEDLVKESQQSLFQKSPDILPQMDGSNDEFLVPRRRYRKRKDGKPKRYCSLFQSDNYGPSTSTTRSRPPRKRRKTSHKSTTCTKVNPFGHIPLANHEKETTTAIYSHKSNLEPVPIRTDPDYDVILVPGTPLHTMPQEEHDIALCPDSLEEVHGTPHQIVDNDSSPELFHGNLFQIANPYKSENTMPNTSLVDNTHTNHFTHDTPSTTFPLSMWSPLDVSPSVNNFFRKKETNGSSQVKSTMLACHIPLPPSEELQNTTITPEISLLSKNVSPELVKSLGKQNQLSLTSFSANKDEQLESQHETGMKVTLTYKPPNSSEIMETFAHYGLPACEYQEAFYAEEKDRPFKPKIIAGRTFRIPLVNEENLPVFAPVLPNGSTVSFRGVEYWLLMESNNKIGEILRPITLGKCPPTRTDITKWLQEQNSIPICEPPDPSQIQGPTPHVNNPHGFLCSQGGFNPDNIPKIVQHLTIMSIEIHANTRGSFQPNPNLDAIAFISYFLQHDSEDANSTASNTGVILIDNSTQPRTGYLDCSPFGCRIHRVSNEEELLDCFANLVITQDPDILVGYEIQSSSLGYLIERASTLGRNLCAELSRTCSYANTDDDIRRDQWGFTHGTGIKIPGRIILNIWRILRSEVKANIYTFENMVYHILHIRRPFYDMKTLTTWFNLKQQCWEEQMELDHLDISPPEKENEWSTCVSLFWLAVRYISDKAVLNIRILDQLDIIGRTSELARLYGIDFYSVLSRGSQYRVESMTLRMTRPQNFVLLSPSRAQVSGMKAPECLPLVMEPESQFYTNPVLVLDFQSLYPSIIIAYNLCYSTCLGKMTHEVPKKFGVTSLDLPNGMLSLLGSNNLTLTPNEVLFTTAQVRKGILPRLLQEILNTRVMVKNAMKQVKGTNPALYRQLDARQFGLKMIANVTYGYTSASFSGRMPCVDIADSIVQTARETLERAIRMVEIQWKGAHVVYGDTDSLFIELPGASKEQAFRVGNEIAKEVTNANPYPVKLKFEKVYLPCLLVSKKRYVGYMYESMEQKEPIFDAKGIETVRRDSCLLVSKIMEKSIRMLFERRNLSIIKSYLYKQWSKIIQNRVSLQDFIFAKEVRLGTYSNKGHPPPAALVCMKKMAKDPRAEPQYGERIPYVVICGTPTAKLYDLVIDPKEVIKSPNTRIHAIYYITKQVIPSLSRLFCLLGVDIKSWYSQMPQKLRLPVRPPQMNNPKQKKTTIEQYYVTRRCPICDNITSDGICSDCHKTPQYTALALAQRVKQIEIQTHKMRMVCMSCSETPNREEIRCVSLDCPVLFERKKLEHAKGEMKNFWMVLQNSA